MNLVMDCTCEAAPVQYEGTINGTPFYFRARYDTWDLTIATSADEAPWPTNQDSILYEASGEYGKAGGYDASYMPFDYAETIIRTHAEIFVKSESK